MAKWSRVLIVREILAHYSKGLPIDEIGGEKGVATHLHYAGRRLFGSWKNAVAAAGLPASQCCRKLSWTPARIIRSIRKLASRRTPLSAIDIKLRYGALVPAARRLFGSWSKAVLAAQVDPLNLRPTKTWTKEAVIECILLKAIRDESLLRKQIEPRALADAGARLFGSWNAALEAAGMSKSLVVQASGKLPLSTTAAKLHQLNDSELARLLHRRGAPWSENEILAAVIQRNRSGAKMNGTAVCHDNQGLYKAALARFGSWNSTMTNAGLTSKRKPRAKKDSR